MTVAAFMDLALYDPGFGYYARASRRSGAAGDFFTSVDTGPLFGRLLARQVAEMATLLDTARPFTLVEAGAGDGRLCRDVIAALRQDLPVLQRMHAYLVERSAAARAAQAGTLNAAGLEDFASSDTLPARFEGVLIANELLDAMPAHVVVMRESGPREVYVEAAATELTAREGPLSSDAIAGQLARSGVELRPGARAEVSLAALEWIRTAARALTRGFIILIDYGHEAQALYGDARPHGTLASFRRHRASNADTATWLQAAGRQDLTTHVDFTAVRDVAEGEGCSVLGFMDQTYFLLALADGMLDTLDDRDRRAFKTLVMPGGLGSTMKVMVLGRNVGRPHLRGCAGAARLT